MGSIPGLKLRSCMLLSTTNWHLPRALPTTEQQRHLPAASMEREPHAELLTFSNPCGGSGKSEALCAPGGLVGQDVFRNRFYDRNPYISSYLFQFSSLAQSAAHQASMSITNSRSSLKLMSTKFMMPSNHLILYVPPSSCL